jgi:hypothetical protein
MTDKTSGSASLEAEWRKVKARIRIMLQNIEGGRPSRIKKLFEEMGKPLDATTIARWMNEADTGELGSQALILILQAWPEVSANYVLGRKPAETVEEQFIEKRIRNSGPGVDSADPKR